MSIWVQPLLTPCTRQPAEELPVLVFSVDNALDTSRTGVGSRLAAAVVSPTGRRLVGASLDPVVAAAGVQHMNGHAVDDGAIDAGEPDAVALGNRGALQSFVCAFLALIASRLAVTRATLARCSGVSSSIRCPNLCSSSPREAIDFGVMGIGGFLNSQDCSRFAQQVNVNS